MDARLTQAESAYLVSAAPSMERERAMALRLAASKAYRARLLHGTAQLLARLGDALFGWVERARIRAELNSLNDRELADIGLSRGDIGRVIGESEAVAETAPARRPVRIGAQQAA
jgi:uncharacterized protein YjiS (DUF1127 family)